MSNFKIGCRGHAMRYVGSGGLVEVNGIHGGRMKR